MENVEFSKIYAIQQARGGFGKNNDDPPFYVPFDSREAKDAARLAFGPECLDCADSAHFTRDCPASFLNRSGIIHPALGQGDPAVVEDRWCRWQQRLCQWAQNRADSRAGRGRKGNNRGCDGRLARLPVASLPSFPFPLQNTGSERTRSVTVGRASMATRRVGGTTVSPALHGVGEQDQEAGCNLPENGQGGAWGARRLPVRIYEGCGGRRVAGSTEPHGVRTPVRGRQGCSDSCVHGVAGHGQPGLLRAREGLQPARVVMLEEDAESKALPNTIKMLDLGKRYSTPAGG